MTVTEFDAALAKAEEQLGIKHLGGTPWHKAPRPRRWHRCSAQTWQVGIFGELKVERCPCGATRLDGQGWWMDRNSRGKS